MAPDLSLAVPLYDEAQNVERVARGLLEALEGVSLELILVDNGSRDGTGGCIEALANGEPRIRPARVEVNRGYGRGVRAGLEGASGAWLGWMGGDGQIDPHDVRRLWERARDADAELVKVARVKRHDGVRRV